MDTYNGELWIITSYFNYAGYPNKKGIFLRFYESLKKQGGRLVVVESAKSKDGFELSDIVVAEGDIYKQILDETDDNLWQKERLLNIALSILPSTCDKIVWSDCDLLFEDNEWIDKTDKLLREYVVVQPFDYAIMFSPKEVFMGLDKTPYGNNCDFKTIKFRGIVSAFLKFGDESLVFNNPLTGGHPGFCCAFRRELLDKHGFPIFRPNGNGDTLMSLAMLGKSDIIGSINICGAEDIYKEWGNKLFEDIKNSVTFLSNSTIFHIYHGSRKNRQYTERKKTLLEEKFNYYNHIICYADPNKLLEWSELTPPSIRKHVNNHFVARKENG